ncbi:MAG: hypothetical protein ACRD3W_16170 [Terriglobales bacterium]
MKGGYTLARSPQGISVFDVIKASEGSRSGIRGEPWSVESVPSHHPLSVVGQLVEDMLRELTVADITEQASSLTDGKPRTVSYTMNAKHMV